MEKTVNSLINSGAELLKKTLKDVDSKNEAKWIMAHILECSPSYLNLSFEQIVAPEIEQEFSSLLFRRTLGEPLQYILGSVPFYDIEIKVGKGVLIPRPETEELVELALALYNKEGPIADVCTGTGAIALCLANNFQETQVFATDLSPEALSYAKQNLDNLGLKNVFLKEGDLYDALPENTKFAMITSNPPYISEDDYQELSIEVLAHEPKMALTDDGDGYSFYRKLVKYAPEHLLPRGQFICEIGCQQGEMVKSFFSLDIWEYVEVIKDSFGADRIINARLK